MTHSMNSADCPTFAVEPQPVLKDIPLERGQEISFKTGRCQYKSSFRIQPASRFQTPSGSASRAHIYSREIRFADPKTQTRFTTKQQPLNDRPSKRFKGNRHNGSGERSFSVRKPLQIHVPTDAWQLIFQRCDLAFLLKARLVCRAFRDILDRQAPWREARKNQFGDDIPDRPLALTEFQYARLLVGKGCQVAACPRKDTRKVYWPFLLRMCDKCFYKSVEVPSLDCPEARSYSEMYRALEYEVRQTIPAQLPGLLPAGNLRSSRWNGPRNLDPEHRRWLQSFAAETTIVLRDDYEALRLDFNEKVQDDPAYFLFWARLRWSKTWEQMSVALKLDEMDFCEPTRPYSLREEKKLLFVEKAQRLDPPMSFNVLHKFAAYHSALDTPNAASLRSWHALKAKIDVPELRAQAEQLAKWQEEAAQCSTDEEGLHERLRRHRSSGRFDAKVDNYAPEQKVVMRIAHQELKSLLDVVHDQDVLLMWFDQVRGAYGRLREKPEGLNGKGTWGPYELMLDDALMIVQDILQPILLATTDGLDQCKRILTSLRCIGCIRSNAATTYSFKELIEHARRVHAGTVANHSYWYRLAVPVKSSDRDQRGKVAWFQLPWFKTMPALPHHRRVTSDLTWNPDIETEYVQHEEPRAKKPAPLTFDKPVTYQTRIPGDDFTSNFCRAVRILLRTRLDSPYIIKVALEYAKRRARPRSPAMTPAGRITAQQLQNLETICARFTSRLDFKFTCRQCFEQSRSRHRTRSPKPQGLSALISHWQSRHLVDQNTCVTEYIVLPTEADLMETMEREDAKLDAEKEALSKKNTRHTEPFDPRTAALLKTPSIRSCLDKLFIPQVEGQIGFCTGRT